MLASLALAPLLLAPAPTTDPLPAIERMLLPLLRGEPGAGIECVAEGRDERVARGRLLLHDAESFVLDVESKVATLRLRRSLEELRVDLVHAGVRLCSKGMDKGCGLAPSGLAERLLGSKRGRLGTLLALAKMRLGAALQEQLDAKVLPGGAVEVVRRDGGSFGNGIVRWRLRPLERLGARTFVPREVKEPERAEFESTLLRALRRAIAIYVPGLHESGAIRERRVPGGLLLAREGQRVVVLRGTPEQIGRAHGELLGPLLARTIDSYVHLVGAVETLRTGKYFLDELRQAWRRLQPHIPHRHVREMNALAAAAGVDAEELRLANVLPEYFHCSGFAVFGKATRNGELFHGRVLDYMTAIGLQDAAVTFYVEPAEGHAFVHVGYAGFVGVVTGLNERGLALGEMGGRGRYDWDGVPMATLMRRTLEECRDLGELRRLWTSVPRTCEYFYVASHAAAKTSSALGIAATSKSIEFLEPGQAHAQLGPGIPDCVYLSAGSRLKTLRERIRAAHGRIDVKEALALMSRPVAMHSNLHNALMIPARGEMLVAHAKGDSPAAEQRYVRHRLGELSHRARDIASDAQLLRIDEKDGAPIRRRGVADRELARSDWIPRSFTAELREDTAARRRVLSFPSPKPLGRTKNDRVVLEWYPAHGDAPRAPAILCLHILDGRMVVARGIARNAARRGIHGFVLHMPGYGERGRDARRAMRLFEARTWQCVADVRRARHLIAALPRVDGERVWLQGTSLGGMVAGLVAAAESRFAGHFLLLAGGDLEGMFRAGRFDIRKVRQAFARAGIDDAERSRILASVDPARFGAHVDASRTWMFNAKDDRVVPAAQARALAEAIGLRGDRHRWFAGGHYTAALFLPAVLDSIWARILGSRTAGGASKPDGIGRIRPRSEEAGSRH